MMCSSMWSLRHVSVPVIALVLGACAPPAVRDERRRSVLVSLPGCSKRRVIGKQDSTRYTRWIVAAGPVVLGIVFPARAVRWQVGGDRPNAVESVDYGRTGRVVIGDGTGRVGYWAGAHGVSFGPKAAMSEREDSSELSAGKTAGGNALGGGAT